MRPTMEQTLLETARVWSQRATCPRLHVGAVTATIERHETKYRWDGRLNTLFVEGETRWGHVLTTGYNGAPRGMPQCDDVGCLIADDHCIRAVHAEENAIYQAARLGISLNGCGMVLTHAPCYRCAKTIIQAGIAVVRYGDGSYTAGHPEIFKLLSSAGIDVAEIREA